MKHRVISPGEAIERAWRPNLSNRRINLATTTDSVGSYYGITPWQQWAIDRQERRERRLTIAILVVAFAALVAAKVLI